MKKVSIKLKNNFVINYEQIISINNTCNLLYIKKIDEVNLRYSILEYNIGLNGYQNY